MSAGEGKDQKFWQKNEKKWLQKWQKEGVYATGEEDGEKEYVLVEFPYPSGSGLHIGHTFTMTGADVYARKKRMEGKHVLFPMGWDAFGLPTENYAIKTGEKPQKVTARNTARYRKQMNQLAFSFDWEKEINTTDPGYYQCTQWIFLQLFKEGLAYKEEKPINWCPSCKTGLANEEVIDGQCERCGAEVSKRDISQWIVKITDYADRLLEGLKKTDFVEKVKKAQINWIGRSRGAKVKFKVQGAKFKVDREIEVFTTRPDTLWGATFMVLAPEHDLVGEIQNPKSKIQKTISESKKEEIREYVRQAHQKSDLERTELEKDKSGVFTGLYAINPVTEEKIPIWVSDFVLATYGTGAIMAVPAHDKRDWQFAEKYDLPIIPVIKPAEGWDFDKAAYTEVESGQMINSGPLNGLNPEEAINKATAILEERSVGKEAVNYHLRDWIFSRQHYWGEPIPMIFCEHCSQNIKLKIQNSPPKADRPADEKLKNDNFSKKLAKYAEKEGFEVEVLLANPGWLPVPEKQLPVKLPEIEEYQPTDSGESPLANITEWVKTTCPVCGESARRETDTMPNWAGSDWYFLGYILADLLKKKKPTEIFSAGEERLRYWLPVDVYIGGDEHNTLHLLYSRFVYQFLHDIGAVPKEHPEPYYKRISHGVILGPDGQKMSKSRGNVINPDEKAQEYGVDPLRLYLMFMGPFEATMAWDESALQGTVRFLDRFKALIKKAPEQGQQQRSTQVLVNRLIKKVSGDIESFSYNTAIAALMEFCNTANNGDLVLTRSDKRAVVKLIAPFAPYLAEELWQELGGDFSVHRTGWPQYKKGLLKAQMNTIIIQVNGKLRGKVEVERDRLSDKEWVVEQAKDHKKVAKYLEGKKIRRTVFVPEKLVNFVV